VVVYGLACLVVWEYNEDCVSALSTRAGPPYRSESREESLRAMYAINFYTSLYEDMLLRGRKTATIRLGDKSDKYRAGELAWITVGQRFGRRRKLFTAIIDSVTVKALSEVTPRELDRENPEMRTHEELAKFLSMLYDRPVIGEHTVTIVHFSPVTE
jgi:hypothetical protein